MNKSIWFGICIFAVNFFLLSPSKAAEIYESNVEGCDIHLTGNIEKGDAQKLENVVRNWDGWSTGGATLCLNSPGGSLLEGKKLFDKIWSGTFETRVRNQEECLSACAIAFLGGTKNLGTGDIRFLSRNIDAGGVLGFHAPSLAIEKGEMIPSETVSRAFEIALKAAEQFFEIKLLEEHSIKAMNDYLYHQILRTRPENMYNIETIGDAVLAGIRVRNLKYPTTIDKEIFKNICDNHWIAKSTVINPNFSSANIYYTQIEENFQDYASERISNSERVTVLNKGTKTIGIVKGYFGDSGYVNLRQTVACIVKLGSNWRDNLNYVEGLDIVDGEGIEVNTIDVSLWSDELPSNQEILDRSAEATENATVPYWYMFNSQLKIIDSVKDSDTVNTALQPQPEKEKYSFKKFRGRDYLGSDLSNGLIRNTTADRCLQQCENNLDCQAITFDRWNRICFLKSANRQSSNLLVNSKADSYIITRHSIIASDVSEIKSEVKTVTRKGKGFKSKPDESFPAFTLDQCEQTTKSKQALAFNWRPKTKKCEVFFSPVEYFNLDNSIVGYFHQEAPD